MIEFGSAYERGDYDFLYANYMGKGHGKLSEAVIERGAEGLVLDLCAGTGHMTKVLLEHTDAHHVVAVDASQAMLDRLQEKTGITGLWSSWALCLDLNRPHALQVLERGLPFKPDLITCRQGVGYLSLDTLLAIPSLLPPGGSFLFNTFVEPPNLEPWFHRRAGGIYEAGVYLLGKVYHLQARWPRLDYTSFQWHDCEQQVVPHWMGQGYRVSVNRHNRTLIIRVDR